MYFCLEQFLIMFLSNIYKMKKLTFLSFIALVILLQSCAPRIPFTQAIREQYQLSENELKQLQFYASHDIVLTRVEEDAKSKTTEDGKLKITTGKEYDQVLIKAGTPGVVEKVVDNQRIAISFEDGNNKYIVFGDPDNRKSNYTMLAPDWKNNRAILVYGGNEYYANKGASNTFVKFKMNKLNKIKRKTTIAKGRKL